MKRILTLLATVTAVVAARADDRKPDDRAYSDAEFLQMVASGDMLESRLGEIAATKATREDVKKVALQIAEDHKKCYADLTKVAEKAGVTLPKKLADEHQKCLDKFLAEKADFDKLYLDENVRGHEMAIAAFKRAAAETKNADIKEFAGKGVTVLQQHADWVKKVRAEK